MDTDLLSPGISVLLGVEEGQTDKTLNEYPEGTCAIKEKTAYDANAHIEKKEDGLANKTFKGRP